VSIDKSPIDHLVRYEIDRIPNHHLDGLAGISFAENSWIKANNAATGRITEAAGLYQPDTRKITLASNVDNIHVIGGNVTSHEVGHHVHMAKMTDAAADEWRSISENGKHARISAYARTNSGEHFAEAYRAYSSEGNKRKALRSLEPASYKFMQSLSKPDSKKLLPQGKYFSGDWMKRYAT
jgi:hypothetical protein